MTARDRALFTLVGPREAEHAAMRSGYSYGRATLRAFCRHRTALAMAILMAALILYACAALATGAASAFHHL